MQPKSFWRRLLTLGSGRSRDAANCPTFHVKGDRVYDDGLSVSEVPPSEDTEPVGTRRRRPLGRWLPRRSLIVDIAVIAAGIATTIGVLRGLLGGGG